MTVLWLLVYIGAGACVTAFLSLVDKMEGKDG